MTPPAPDQGDRLPDRATPEGTARYAKEHPASEGHYREWRGLTVSSLGMGSYLGEVGPEANAAYEAAAGAALAGGVNVLDTAINYRGQQSERDIGRALREFGHRDQVVVATKGGFIPQDAAREESFQEHFVREFAEPGVVEPRDVVGGQHCMTPRYLSHQLHRSLDNLGLESVDVYFVHNPEFQLANGVPREEFESRLRAAFEELERHVDAGRVGAYGLATWQGLRVAPDDPRHVSLQAALRLAAEARGAVGGDPADHHLGAVELPVNLGMAEAAGPTQSWNDDTRSTLQVAHAQGLLVLASATLLQGRLLGQLGEGVREALRAGDDDAVAAMEFTRSLPGVTTALVGMGNPDHARANAQALRDRAPRPGAVVGLLRG